MLHKIPLFFLFFFLFSSSLLAQDNEKFANMACRFIGCNRSVLHCELQQKQILVIRTSDGKELKLLCVWFPQTRGDAYELDEVTASLREKADNVLIGYGQAPGNPMFCYCLQAKKISKKIKKGEWEKYKIPLSLCDYRFGYTALSFKRKKIDKMPLPDSF